MTTGRINQVAVFGNETCNTSSSPVEGGFRKQISLLRTTPSQRRRSLFFTSPFPVTCIDTHSEPFRLSKLSPLSQTRTTSWLLHRSCCWAGPARTPMASGIRFRSPVPIGRKRIGFPEDTSLKQFPFEGGQENWMWPSDYLQSQKFS